MTMRDLNEAVFIARFLAKIEIKESGCWEWKAAVRPDGYARFRYGDKGQYAHRFAYEQFNHETIPHGLEIDHLCRNRRCVNPDHLEVVTRRINTLRGISPAAQYAKRKHCSNGHLLDGDNLYLNRGARVCRICRHEYKKRHNTNEVSQ